jgi:hypothetical protein
VCPSGGYYQEHIFDILDEVTSRYDIDGIFFNWATMNEEDYYKHYHGVCHCVNCQARWRDFAGELVLPSGPTDSSYGIWVAFSRKIIDSITARIRSFVEKRLPKAAVIRGETANIIYQEANNEIGREMWHHSTSENVSTLIAYCPEVPVLGNSTCFLDMRYRMAGEEPAHFAQYLLQCISRGGYPSTYMMGTPGKIPYPCLDVASEITKDHRRWSSVYAGSRPCAKTGLVRPDGGYRGSQEYKDSVSEFRGLYMSLQQRHIPFDVLALEYLVAMESNGSLARYKTIVLPDLGQLKPEVVKTLSSWVECGGTLLVTGSPGLDEDGTVQLKSLPAKCCRAAVTKDRLIWSSYVAPSQKNKGIHYYNGPMIPIFGAAYYFDWDDGTQKGYQVLARAPFSPPEKAYGNIEIDQPGYVTTSYGLGTSTMIPFTVGRGYHELGLSCLRDFFIEVFMQDAAKEMLSFDIAEQVEVTMHQVGDKIIIHLLNMSGARRQSFGAHLPILDGLIKVPQGLNVTAQALKADMELSVKDGQISLPTLDLYEVVVLGGLIGKDTNGTDASHPAMDLSSMYGEHGENGVNPLNGLDGMNGLGDS